MKRIVKVLLVVLLLACMCACEGASGPKMEGVSKGDKITHDFATLSVKEAGTTDNLQIKSKSSGLSVTSGPKSEAGKTYVYIKGTLKNLAKEKLSVDIVGTILIDGYTYEVETFLCHEDATPTFSVDALDSVTYIIYSSIPDELIKDYESCTINFGFDDYFNNSSFDKVESCKYQYTLTLK